VIILITLIQIHREIGYKALFLRAKKVGLKNFVLESIYFETLVMIIAALLLPYIILRQFPAITYEITISEQLGWVLTPYATIFFLVGTPIILFTGLYIHNTQGMIVSLYGLSFGIVITIIVDRVPYTRILPPYLIIGSIVFVLAWASSGILRERKRLGYAVTIVGDLNTSIIENAISELSNSLRTNIGKKITLIGDYIALSADKIGGTYSQDYWISYNPSKILISKFLNRQVHPFLRLPYSYYIGEKITFKDFVDLPDKTKFFYWQGDIYEYLGNNKVRRITTRLENINDYLDIKDINLNMQSEVIPILPKASDILNALFFRFAKIKIRCISTHIHGKKVSLIYSYIWAPGSMVPSPLAYATLKIIRDYLKIENEPIWIIFKGDFGTRYLSGISPEPKLVTIGLPNPDSIDLDTIIKIGETYVEREPKTLEMRRKISKVVVMIISFIPTIIKLLLR